MPGDLIIYIMPFPIAALLGAIGSATGAGLSLFGQQNSIDAQRAASRDAANQQLRSTALMGDALRQQKQTQGVSTAFQGQGVTPAPSVSSFPSSPSFDMSDILKGYNSDIDNLLKIAQTKTEGSKQTNLDADTGLKSAETGLKFAESGLRNAETENVVVNTEFIRKQLDNYDRVTDAQVNQMIAHANLENTEVSAISQKLPYELRSLEAATLDALARQELTQAQVLEVYQSMRESVERINHIGAMINELDASARLKLANIGLTENNAKLALANANGIRLQNEITEAKGVDWLANMSKVQDVIGAFSDLAGAAGNIGQFVFAKKFATQHSGKTGGITINNNIDPKNFRKK